MQTNFQKFQIRGSGDLQNHAIFSNFQHIFETILMILFGKNNSNAENFLFLAVLR